MQLSAPIFRRACPGSQEAFVHLPSLLLQSNLSLRYFAVFDTLMSVITNRPMFFRYNVAFTQQVPESKMYIQDYFGMQWFYGVPDRLVITLARMNALREDYGDCVGTTTIRELELEIANFQPVLGPSDEPTLIVSRLVVQECWRQAAYIYLYMVSISIISLACSDIEAGPMQCGLSRFSSQACTNEIHGTLSRNKTGKEPGRVLDTSNNHSASRPNTCP
jgi:hypothetical protein